MLAYAPGAARCNHGLAGLDFGITEAEETAARLVRPNLSAAQFVGLHAVLQPYGLDARSVGRIVVKFPQINTKTVRECLEWLESDEMGVSRDKMGGMVAKCPNLLTYSVDANLRPTVQYFLDEVGEPRQDGRDGGEVSTVVRQLQCGCQPASDSAIFS